MDSLFTSLMSVHTIFDREYHTDEGLFGLARRSNCHSLSTRVRNIVSPRGKSPSLLSTRHSVWLKLRNKSLVHGCINPEYVLCHRFLRRTNERNQRGEKSRERGQRQRHARNEEMEKQPHHSKRRANKRIFRRR